MASNYTEETPKHSGGCCPACLEMYSDPISLTCSHAFCESCIRECILLQEADAKLKEGIYCPLCRKITTIIPSDTPPEKWSNTLLGNYALQEETESSRTVEKKDADLCNVCQNKQMHTVASRYCIQCKKELCDDCEKLHNIFEQFESHRVVDIVDKLILQTLSNELDQCTVHEKLIEFYCVDEKKLCCSSCAIGKHRKCIDVTEISEIAEKQTDEIAQPLMKKMREITSRASKVNNFFQYNEHNIDNQIKAIDKKLIDEHDKIIDMLNLSRTNILADAAGVRNEANVKYKLLRHKCNGITSSVEESVQNLAVVRRHGTPSQLFIALHKQEIQLAEYVQHSKEQCADLKYVDIFAETEDVVQQLFKSQSLWKLQTHEVATLVSDIPEYWKVKLELVASVDVIALNDNENEPLYTGMAFLPDGRLIVIDNHGYICLLMNEQLEVVGSYQHTTNLYDVVSVSNTDIIVTGVHTLEKLKLKGDEFIHDGTTKIKSRSDSLSEMDQGQFVIGTFRGKHPAKILCMSGEEKYFDLKFPEKDWNLEDSTCIFDKDTAKLVVTDMFQHRVYIYDTKDNSEVIVTDDRIREPRGVAFGPFQCIFVCSSETGSIAQLSMFGEILDTHVLDMEFPGTLCFSKCKSVVAVSNYARKKKKLQRFKVVPLKL